MKRFIIALIFASSSSFASTEILSSENFQSQYYIVTVKDANEYTKRYTITQIMVDIRSHIYCIGAVAHFTEKNQRYGLPEAQSCFPGDTSQWEDVVKGTMSYDIEQYVIKHKPMEKPVNKSESYFNQLAAIIRPYVAIPSHINPNAQAIVEVHLSSNMYVQNVKLIRSSGNALYDQSIQAAIKRVAIFPPLPKWANFNDYKDIKITFHP